MRCRSNSCLNGSSLTEVVDVLVEVRLQVPEHELGDRLGDALVLAILNEQVLAPRRQLAADRLLGLSGRRR